MSSPKKIFGRASLPRRYCYDERRERNSTTVAKFSSKQYPFSLAKTPSALCEMISRTRRGLLTCKVRLSEISWVAHKIARGFRTGSHVPWTAGADLKTTAVWHERHLLTANRDLLGTKYSFADHRHSRRDRSYSLDLINNSPAAYIIRIPNSSNSS